jgi:hypothetical protein
VTLVRDPDKPALWRNDAWQPGGPGTFAVIIGVSQYEHLDGTAESFGLGSLFCSSLTAHYVFEWLRERYRGPCFAPDSPRLPAKVWYLVAPTAAEADIEPALSDAPVEPTLSNCTDAIGQWDAAIRALSVENAGKSTALFFFSGHGFEVHSQEQLLLPSDYLSPPTRNVNKGISTYHLYNGLSDVDLNEQLFFVDACRNDVDTLRAKNPRGETILNQPGARAANPNRIAALVHATSSGQQAFQPLDPSEGPSLFGKALLEGLSGRPDVRLEGDGDECTVNLLALNAFLKKRVVELLEERSASVAQPVWMRMNNVDDFPISVVARRRATAIVRGGRGVSGELAVAGVRSMADIAAARLSRDVTSPDAVDAGAKALWAAAELYDFESKSWRGAAGASETHGITEDRHGRSMRIDFTPQTRGRCWLRLRSAGACYAFLLPGDRHFAPTYRLEMIGNGASGDELRIDQALVDLVPRGFESLVYAAELWQTFRDRDLSAAIAALDMNLLEELLRDKLQSPLAASVAGVVLLRTGTLWRMHDWARNLSNFFPEWPEGPVLWAKQLSEQHGEVRRYAGSRREFAVESREDPLVWLMQVEDRGLPALSELMGAAAEIVDQHSERALGLTSAERDRFERVRSHLGLASRHFRPGGLFTGFHAADALMLEPTLAGP